MRIEPVGPTRYGSPLAWLHWLSASTIIAAAMIGWYMVALPMSLRALKLFNWHKWLGVSALALLLLRLGARLYGPVPAPPPMSRTQQSLARFAHLALYVLMLSTPLLGWAYSSAAGFPVRWWGLLPLPDWVPRDRALAAALKPLHQASAWLLVGLAALHIGAALKHQFLDRDGLLRRMRPW